GQPQVLVSNHRFHAVACKSLAPRKRLLPQLRETACGPNPYRSSASGVHSECGHVGSSPHTKPVAASDAIHLWQSRDPTARADSSQTIVPPRRSAKDSQPQYQSAQYSSHELRQALRSHGIVIEEEKFGCQFVRKGYS